MSYFNLKFRVDFLGHVKNVIINILFFTVYTSRLDSIIDPWELRNNELFEKFI